MWGRGPNGEWGVGGAGGQEAEERGRDKEVRKEMNAVGKVPRRWRSDLVEGEGGVGRGGGSRCKKVGISYPQQTYSTCPQRRSPMYQLSLWLVSIIKRKHQTPLPSLSPRGDTDLHGPQIAQGGNGSLARRSPESPKGTANDDKNCKCFG